MDDPSLVLDGIVQACTHPKEEMPIGPKARLSYISHQLLPNITERMTATPFRSESEKGFEVPPTNGSLFELMEEGRTIEGGIRDRMKIEDGQTVGD